MFQNSSEMSRDRWVSEMPKSAPYKESIFIDGLRCRRPHVHDPKLQAEHGQLKGAEFAPRHTKWVHTILALDEQAEICTVTYNPKSFKNVIAIWHMLQGHDPTGLSWPFATCAHLAIQNAGPQHADISEICVPLLLASLWSPLAMAFNW